MSRVHRCEQNRRAWKAAMTGPLTGDGTRTQPRYSLFTKPFRGLQVLRFGRFDAPKVTVL